MKRARTQLTDEDKGKILGLSEYFSSEKIAVKMKCSPITIRRFLAKYEETGKIENFSRSGRPQVLSNAKKEALVQEAVTARCKKLRKILDDLELKSSLTTAKNILYMLEFILILQP